MVISDYTIYQKLSNSIKCLTIDAIEVANSGHPGLPLGMADVISVLFKDFVKFDVDHPEWMNRDRFILSAGHGSMLLYSLIFLLGYKDISLDDIKNFRQLGSKAAGHPEYGLLEAIETTTGPLGQGLANAVGMSLASKILAKEYRDELLDHKIYVLVGDGCLMEGISHEAVSLAGHLNLDNLIILFDDNKVSIDGPVSLADSTDNLMRFHSYGWNCLKANGHNYKEIYEVLNKAQVSNKPCFINFETQIGHSASNAGHHILHGGALGKEEIKHIKKSFGYEDIPFTIDEETKVLWRDLVKDKKQFYQKWYSIYTGLDSFQKGELARRLNNKLPENFTQCIDECYADIQASDLQREATRKSSGRVLKYLASYLPELIGGSADLAESTDTMTNKNHFIHYGVREHAMAGIMNGIALYNGFIPYGGTFLVFSDYMRPSIRLAALMKQKVVYILTHDSIGVGEDGPTHQPIEHLASFRAMPELMVFRPADAIETLECWEIALRTNGPSIIALTRQDVAQSRTDLIENKSMKGGYMSQEDQDPQITIIATGSEVEIALETKKLLNDYSLRVKIVSMPCFQLFDMQDESYRQEILGNTKLKVAIEAACSFGWEKYIGIEGMFFGVNTFGASGKKQDLYEYFNLTATKIANQIMIKFNEVK